MPFSRLLLAIDPALDAAPVLRAAERIAPSATEVHVVALLSDEGAPAARRGLGLSTLEQVQDDLRTWSAGGQPIAGTVETSFDIARVAEAAQEHRADLVVLGPWTVCSPTERMLRLLELNSREGFPVLSVGAGAGRSPYKTGTIGLLLEIDGAGLVNAAELLRRISGVERVAAFVARADPGELAGLRTMLAALIPDRPVELVPLDATAITLADAVLAAATTKEVELMVVASDGISGVSALVRGLFAAQLFQDAAQPTLVLRRHAPREGMITERLVASDTLLLGAQPSGVAPSDRRPVSARIAIERTSAIGRSTLAQDERFRLGGGPPLAHEEGVVRLGPRPPGIGLVPLTLISERSPPELAPFFGLVPSRPILLIDATLEAATFADAAPLGRDLEPVFVRLRGADAIDNLRAQLSERSPWAGAPLLIDASAWLDDGGATDVPRSLDGQRLLRVATRLCKLGAPIAAILVRGELRPRSRTIATFTPQDLAARDPTAPPPTFRPVIEEPMAMVCGAESVAGNLVELELDNASGRAEVLRAIAAATQRIHWQCYIVEDDAIAEAVAGELRQAARRGVQVRVLVDAVYSRYEGLGSANPVLERLAAEPGIEIRAYQPITGLPSLNALKQRNHRKLVIFDGQSAIVTGRNLGAPYYSGFAEVELKASSLYREVPWLDASAQVRGPVVGAIDAAFRREWTRSGGADFEVSTPPPAGDMSCRLILHEGLLDTHTLDAQLALIERAEQRLVVMNTFPLLLEIQRALIAAVRRGVSVQFIFGSVRPRWGLDQPFEGGLYRALGDDLVRSRLDPVVRAGAQGYEVALPPMPRWDPELGCVFPHVHAKLLIRDEADVAIGSANLDVTSAYWESESVLLVEHAGFARSALALVEPLIQGGRRVDLGSEHWLKDAARRAWLGRNWPSLVG